MLKPYNLSVKPGLLGLLFRILIDVDPIEAHQHFHEPIRPQILADKITSRMIHMQKANPLESAIKIRDLVMGEDFHTLLEEDQRLVERCLPARPENTLNKIKNRLMGSLPKSREEFDVQRFLELAKSMMGTTKLVILDSNNPAHLPVDWRQRNMKDLVENNPPVSTASSVASSIASSVGSSVGADLDHQMADAELNDEVTIKLIIVCRPRFL